MAMELIAQYEVSTPVENVVFNSIPQDGTSLMIKISARKTTDWWPIYFQFNGDTGGNYNQLYLRGNSSQTAETALQQGRVNIFIGAATKSDHPANDFSTGEILLANYSSSSRAKSWSSENSNLMSDTTREHYLDLRGGTYDSTSPITSFKVFALNNNFAQYTTFSIYKIS